ncbi:MULTISPECIES: EscU/YscU/HrcU family type III secretion system export apparatus switch protein [unclassified Duganella]|uniref:EscU/YscU/HrcU family type III secretion system export apparatus switch protein n=1 Tax=unclassified Duganella TaxID=2636909 RepID=UPI0006FC3D9D|nr:MULTISPECIES: EscU/YscU/HrcU family type III secretion system export apparatus switch protein [unclassified Duganella]KQV54253.1 flagellar biosynthetic protein FlhB [Duganella sp. Root336D2]KRC03380.1 flagellar biosynthetic protein FlhB [Duganella sp. Root198D2]
MAPSDNSEQPRKPLQSAVALAYKSGEAAPKVVAKGRGLVAEQIIAVAAEHGVHIHESKELVSLLMEVDLDHQIPPLLYRVIAELLAWLYHIEAAQKTGQPAPAAPDLSVPTEAPKNGL